MSQEQNYDNLSYDELLKMARETAKIWIPRLCAALRRENLNYSNYDTREIVKKNCMDMAKGYNNRCFT
jgi:ribosomal protein L20